MKKVFITLVLSICSMVGFAQSNMTMHSFIDLLDNIEGYVFIGQGERRDLSVPFAKTDSVFSHLDGEYAIQDLDWSVLNTNILSCDSDGVIEGLTFGETIVTAKEGIDEHNFIVFVCPRITVLSPEGPIYSHNKVYGHPMKVTFTDSKRYKINCIMLDELDITDDIQDGYYESENEITRDHMMTITMANAETDVRLQVIGNEIQFIKNGIIYNDINSITIENSKSKKSESYMKRYKTYSKNSNGKFYIEESGVYFTTVTIDNKQIEYKFIIG